MSLLWLIFFTGIILLFQGWLYRKLGSLRMYYTRYFEKTSVFEGEEVRLIEYIANKKLLPLPWVRVESKIDSGLRFKKQFNLDIKHQQFHKSLFTLMPYSSIKRLHNIKCLKRGCFKLTSAALTFGDLFGMSESTKISSFSTELLVYPKLLPLSDVKLPSHSFMGDAAVKRWIIDDPFMTAGVREYLPGDPLNRINWKMSAKTMSLKVRNHDYTADPKLIIYINVESEEGMWGSITDPDLIEKGISIAATIAQQAISQGVSVGLRSNGSISEHEENPIFVPAGSGFEHFESILQTLARMAIKRTVTFYTLLEDDIQNRTTNSDMLLISSYTNQKLEAQTEALTQSGNAVQLFKLEKAFKEGEIDD
jgi:uncharacterized protein (DUF58 family)